MDGKAIRAVLGEAARSGKPISYAIAVGRTADATTLVLDRTKAPAKLMAGLKDGAGGKLGNGTISVAKGTARVVQAKTVSGLELALRQQFRTAGAKLTVTLSSGKDGPGDARARGKLTAEEEDALLARLAKVEKLLKSV